VALLKALALVGSEALAEPAFVFALADLDASPGETHSAGSERFYAPKLLPQSGELELTQCRGALRKIGADNNPAERVLRGVALGRKTISLPNPIAVGERAADAIELGRFAWPLSVRVLGWNGSNERPRIRMLRLAKDSLRIALFDDFAAPHHQYVRA
jgi:hypothetical protein